MLKRLLFVILVIPFLIVATIVVVSSIVWWIFTGKDLMFINDYLTEKMKNLLI
jgi:hypothetical protein